MNQTEITALVAEKNEQLTRETALQASYLINRIGRLHGEKRDIDRQIETARTELRALEIRQINPESILGS